MPANRAVIFANGSLPSISRVRALLREDDFLIAADGGARHILRLDLTPALVVGDLDSINRPDLSATQESGGEVKQYPVDKDETDLELAVREAVARGYRQILVIAALGGRLDHTLANLYLMRDPVLSGCEIRLDDGRVEVFWIRMKARVNGKKGDLVSLLPLLGAAEGIVTYGLKYPLRGETLLPEKTRGISNEMLGESAEVALSKGSLLLIHTRK